MVLLGNWQALVDMPDIVRQPVSFKRLALTDLKVDCGRLPKKANLKKAIEDARTSPMRIIFILKRLSFSVAFR